MASLANKLRENHELAAATQQSLRNGRRVIRHVADGEEPISLDKAPAVIENPLPMAVAHTAITLSPLDLPTEQFSAGLERRKQNRQLLMEWLRTALVDGVDFGRIHIVSRDRCQFARQGRAKECPDPNHFSKASLFKPGAEKITGMLGMTAHFPSLPDYEKAVLAHADITTIVMRCELRDAQGRVVAEGVGARNLSQDYGDINKSLKMVEKSAHIDATLRLAGLSEVFTQDIEDRPLVEEEAPEPPPEPAPKPKPKPVSRRSSAKPAALASHATAATDAKSATAATTPDDRETEIVSDDDVASLRQRITQYGFTEKRVLTWLHKFTDGSVVTLEQLTIPQCVALLKRLDLWAEAEKSFAKGKGGRS